MVRPTLSVVAAPEVSDDEFDSGLQHEWPAEGRPER